VIEKERVRHWEIVRGNRGKEGRKREKGGLIEYEK
jgi:hypothetical protein